MFPNWRKTLYAVAALTLGVLVSLYFVQTKPQPSKKRPPVRPPAVRVQKAVVKDLRLTVTAQGVVQPRSETQLAAEVPGRVIYISPAMAAGGFFESGEILLKLDPADYEIAVVQARGVLAKAELELALRRAEGESAREEWQGLKQGKASPLLLKKPHLAEARAALKSAQAALRRATLNLARTVIKAPYAGRVRKEFVDLGQYVTTGYKMAEIYAVDYAEVRLPLTDDNLAYLDLPMDYRNGRSDHPHPQVTVRAGFGGAEYSWPGEIVRTEGELDPRSRMVIAVAQIKNPYGRGGAPGRPPLASGLYVDAVIQGRLAHQVAVLPRSALRSPDQVLVVGPDGRLRFRKVKVLMLQSGRAVISRGLKDGEQVVITQPPAVVDKMPVVVIPDKAPPAAQPPASPKQDPKP